MEQRLLADWGLAIIGALFLVELFEEYWAQNYDKTGWNPGRFKRGTAILGALLVLDLIYYFTA